MNFFGKLKVLTKRFRSDLTSLYRSSSLNKLVFWKIPTSNTSWQIANNLPETKQKQKFFVAVGEDSNGPIKSPTPVWNKQAYKQHDEIDIALWSKPEAKWF